jgi:hypothetical protein
MNLAKIYDWFSITNVTKEKEKVSLALIEEEFNELKEATNDTEKIDAIIDLFWVILQYAKTQNFSLEDLEKYSDLVLESNYSKFGTKEEILHSIQLYSEGKHPDKNIKIPNCSIKEGKDMLGITRYYVENEAKKVLKNYKYKKLI